MPVFKFFRIYVCLREGSTNLKRRLGSIDGVAVVGIYPQLTILGKSGNRKSYPGSLVIRVGFHQELRGYSLDGSLTDHKGREVA